MSVSSVRFGGHVNAGPTRKRAGYRGSSIAGTVTGHMNSTYAQIANCLSGIKEG
jgi:hypothetical protein